VTRQTQHTLDRRDCGIEPTHESVIAMPQATQVTQAFLELNSDFSGEALNR